MQDRLERMQELVLLLTEASKAYYAEDKEILSNYEYDRLCDELEKLEKESGIILADSPSVHIGYEAVEELPKEAHEKPMLSLGKTKSREELMEWLGENEALLSWKLDGLTVVLTYGDGKLQKAVTRGNGEVGEVVTNNARVFRNLPMQIPFEGEMILRGEAVISYSDFEKINRELPEADAKYKNPRNLCSGSVRQLNNEITAARNVRFYAFSLVRAQGAQLGNSREEEMLFLKKLGFAVVEYERVTADNLTDTLDRFAGAIESYDIPSDGLVLTLEDIAYGNSLGVTAKFPRDSIAFKWADEIRETNLMEIEWSASRTGLINPIAVFEPVELEGTTVSRASVHNVSVMRQLKLGCGDRITVYKANMIIPQIAENLTGSASAAIPEQCPVCGGPTQLRDVNEVQSLYCINEDCEAKKIKAFTLFVSRNALNIEGLSEATLEKFIARGFIHSFSDIYHLDRYAQEIQDMEGLGEKSYQNLIKSIDKSRDTVLFKVIYGLGIANIGLANAKMICREFHNDFERMKTAQPEELCTIDGVGEVIANTFCEYFRKESNLNQITLLLKELRIAGEEETDLEQTLAGVNVVITGGLEHFENRDAMKEAIEKRGGKVTGSVTSRTGVLVNNDNLSTSSKNKKAKELDVPIMTEEEFLLRYLDSGMIPAESAEEKEE